MKKYLSFTLAMLCFTQVFAQKTVQCVSPNQQLKVNIEIGDNLRWSLVKNNKTLVQPSTISLVLNGGEILGQKPKGLSLKKSMNNDLIHTSLYKKKEIKNSYNEMSLSFSGNYSVVFRVYDDGVAYRFVTARKGDLVVKQEVAEFNLNDVDYTYVPWVNVRDTMNLEPQFASSFENQYVKIPLKSWSKTRLAFLPTLAVNKDGVNLCITEADLEDYPGMYLQNKNGSTCLTGVFANYPRKVRPAGHNKLELLVDEREDYIAKTSGTRSFPWRTVIVTDDKGLADNDMVYRLASPSRIKDQSWIKPGKVAWDWWNDWNIYGVDFESGINNATYKYYIDFASAHGLQYVILDEGWAVNLQADLMKVVPEIDIKELCDYGKSKGVGIILWAGMYALDKDIDGICKYYSEMGVKGFKVDFLNRDDQLMVDYCYKVAKIAAKYQLMIDFHGVFKPTGLQRTYPNVINFEGVFGLEQMKWSGSSVDMVTYDVTIPFIRMVAGPMDYTQGAMRNASRHNYRAINSEPMSQGTRCRQLAEYVVFESPFSMLCDNPSNYMREAECMSYISSIPTVWDQTQILTAKVGEYIVTARQKGDDWYVGGMTNWDARTMKIDLSFLPEGNYEVELFSDGVNANRVARDYKRKVFQLTDKTMEIRMAPGGGFAMAIRKVK